MGVDLGPISNLRAALVPELETVVHVEWTQDDAGDAWLEFSANGGAWQQSPVEARTVGPAEEWIVGVPYEADVDWRVVVDGTVVPGSEQSIRTGDWPDTLPEPVMLVNEPMLTDPDTPWIITSMNRDDDPRYGQWWVFVMDRDGQVVWAQETPEDWVSRHVSVSWDGDALLVDRDTFWTTFDQGEGSEIVEMTLDGTLHHTWEVPGLHHAFLPLPDGVIAWPAKADGDTSTEVLETVDRKGHHQQHWFFDDWHDDIVVRDVCGSNGIFWSQDTNRFLISFWSTDTVVEIDGNTWQATRWFGEVPGSYTFDPPASQFWWQHGPTITPSGTLMVSSKDERSGTETVIREYTIDDKTQTLHEVWNFGEGRGIYGPFMGEAHRLGNGNTLHVYGAGGHLAEATPDGSVAWEVTWIGDKHNGRTTAFGNLYDLLP